MILIAVILFGALSYTVANMMRGGNAEVIGQEQANLLADEILAQGQQFRHAVQDMRISNACDDDEISFENPVVAGYTNGTNTDCQIFNSDGGGMNYIAPVADWLDSGQSGQTSYGQWVLTGFDRVPDVGTTASAPDDKELILKLPYVKKIVCEAINEKAGVTNPSGNPPQESGAHDISTKFTGSYGSGADELDTGGGEIDSHLAGCVEGNTSPPSGTYHFYQVLLAR